ncbi:MAG TPA: glycoside hydrolase family 130 protein [Terriglobia bacterium]|nr:glycoside hydrolase family 130 protein [Terriglobia bacterium]
MKPINVQRTKITLYPDRKRVLARPFHFMSGERASEICARVMALSEDKVQTLLGQLWAEFDGRHKNIREFFRRRFDEVRPYLLSDLTLSEERALLMGGYFTHEYSFEAAALFNPSIVPHPDQSNLAVGSQRLVLSLRATGEGHISSLTFRSGVVDSDGKLVIDAPTPYSLEPARVSNARLEKLLLERKLRELNLLGAFSREVLKPLGELFTLEELRDSVSLATKELRVRDLETEKVAKKTLELAQSCFDVQFDADSSLSERVLFPFTAAQSHGIEDARFVRFQDDDGTRTYCATYTAYNGKEIQPQFLETADFLHFKFITLSGPAVENKGMALFPRKIKGLYAMLGRQDYENLYVMFSDHLHFWHTAQAILRPEFPWEFIQLGNCGSPIETEAGWLVISHGVGPMRKYCIGAFLLDRDDPTQVIGRLREPLLKPDKDEREGYVPNVVYSCGSLVHGGQLIIPYGTSDYATTFATVPLDEVLAAMESF